MYNLGLLAETIQLLEPCLPEGFLEQGQSTRALRLIALAHYALDDLDQASQAIKDLLSVDRGYRADPDTDPLFFQDRVDELRRPRLFYQTTTFQVAVGAVLGGVLAFVAFREKKTGKVLVFATDTEHYDDRIDQNLLKLSRDCDVLVYDGQFTSKEYAGGGGSPSRKGWGHSTWEKGIEVALMAHVKRLIITHHEPQHNDAFLDRMQRAARRHLSARKNGNPKLRLDWGYEGLTINLKKK